MSDGVQVRVVNPTTSAQVRVANQQAVQVRSTTQTVTFRTIGQGPAGPVGPTGPAGITTVEHGADGSVARPDSPVVYWIGSTQPLNAEPYDLWYLT